MARDFADKSAARQWVWDRLVAERVARFPFPPHGRIPNFAGAELAAARLLEIEPWKSATAIKVNPDSPQRPLRAEALLRGITVFVPTPRLRGGFKKLDPRRIPPDKIQEAAGLSRGDRWSGSKRTCRIQVWRREAAPQWRAPLGLIPRTSVVRRRSSRSPSPGHHPSACSGVKALRNTSDAKRQAAKLR